MIIIGEKEDRKGNWGRRAPIGGPRKMQRGGSAGGGPGGVWIAVDLEKSARGA